MRPSTAVLSAATLVAGVAGGSMAYERASGADERTSLGVTTTMTPTDSPSRPVRSPRVRVRWAPCEAPAVLRGGTCVTAVVRTVVVPGAVTATTTTGGAVAPPTYQVQASTKAPDDNGNDHHGDDGGDDQIGGERDDGGEDHGDDGGRHDQHDEGRDD